MNINVGVLHVDNCINEIDKVICRHFDSIGFNTRGAVSQDVLSQLRHLVEHIMLRFYTRGQDMDNSYDNICHGVEYVRGRGDLKVLRRFHDFLQIVASHYTLDEENSERLMLKYYEYLVKTRNLVLEEFGYEILKNLENFPLDLDTNLQEYYEKIALIIGGHANEGKIQNEKYYIQKVKPFFVSNNVFYEIIFTPANDYASKHNRVIAFTNQEIDGNYAVQLSLVNDSIDILGKTMPVLIVKKWRVAIRDCEYKNFTKMIRGRSVTTAAVERRGISDFLTFSGFNLSELVQLDKSSFELIKQKATENARKIVFFEDLETCRRLVSNNHQGSNILLYLLSNMNNRLIKLQTSNFPNQNLANLYLMNGSIPFDKMPFNSSLIGHNPKVSDLFKIINCRDRKHEILARTIRNNSEIKGNLFTPLNELENFEDIDTLIRKFNQKLWFGHLEKSKLVNEMGHVFINGYRANTVTIIEELKGMTGSGIQNYSQSMDNWLTNTNNGVDCDEKKSALRKMFDESRVALVYGSAGTGKSTLIQHISEYFSDRSKLFLAQTNPAVDNLKRKVKVHNSSYMTIAKFLRRGNIITDYDVLIVDECSTVSNKDMKELLEKATYRLLILVGDSYQIASIRFGNWFDLAKAFVPEKAVTELTKPYRSTDNDLLLLWNRVRYMEDNILELIARKRYSTTLDESIFEEAEDDEIILCLNYDGLYGINNINRFLQESNRGAAVTWGVQKYKVNDPILFHASERFAPVIYNNMKGRIVAVSILDAGLVTERIQFDIELETVIDGMDAYGQSFDLLPTQEGRNSIIRFVVNRLKSADDDDDSSEMSVVPFQVAYAVSIHKAQGLEYKSVKIVITDEVEELITHNVFYTAITRAREKLRIYWSPEVGHKILTNIKPRSIARDISLLKRNLN